jgi:Xaa-Pro aminopeptidase
LVGAKPSELQKEIYDTVVEMQDRFRDLLKPGITTHDLAKWRPRPGENFKTPEQIKKWRATWSNHMGSTGIAWDSSPCYFSLDDPEIELEKNMVLAYHAMLHAQGEAGGVAIENTYRITETGCESLTKWPYEEIQIIGL